MRVYTIGFTKKSAADFFELLRGSGAKRLVDVRLSNASQLAGFAKKDDLAYFLDKICRMKYVHLPELAPTREMLDSYRKEHRNWETYESEFLALMERRRIGDKGAEADHCQWLPAVQRGQTRTLPPPSRGRIPPAKLGRRRHCSPGVAATAACGSSEGCSHAPGYLGST